jgi:hypothetical protein
MRNKFDRNKLNVKVIFRRPLFLVKIATILLFTPTFNSFAEKNNTSIVGINQQQKIQITGTVMDEDNLSVIGANVIEEGTTNGRTSFYPTRVQFLKRGYPKLRMTRRKTLFSRKLANSN